MREIKTYMPSMKKVFESVFYGQVYKLGDVGYDVPKLTQWCQKNLPVVDIPLKSLTMSKSDEKHGSKEFKDHAKKIKRKLFPIVTVLRNDGKLQIADGNHRAWNEMEAGEETIKGYICPENNLPEEAMADESEGEAEKDE